MNYTKTSWDNWKKESLNGKYRMAWFGSLNIPFTAGGWTCRCFLDPTGREAGIPADMIGVEPELLWQLLHPGRKEVNVEAVRLRNQILKHLRSAQPMTPKQPCQSVCGQPASYLLSSDASSQTSPSSFTLVAWRSQAHAIGSRNNKYQNWS